MADNAFADLIPQTAAPQAAAPVNPFADLIPPTPSWLDTGISKATQVLNALTPSLGPLPSVNAMSPEDVQRLLNTQIPSAVIGAGAELQKMATPFQMLSSPATQADFQQRTQTVNQQAQQASPGGFNVGKIGADVGLGTLGAVGGEAVAAPLLGLAGITGLPAAIGTGISAGLGAGALPPPSGNSTRLGSGLTSAAFSGAVPLLGAGLSTLKPAMTPVMDYFRSFTNAGRQADLGDKLLQIAGGNVPSLMESPLPGMKLSLGQSTENPGLLAFEKGALNTPQGQNVYNVNRNINNLAMIKAAQQVAPGMQADALPGLSSNLGDSLAQAKKNAYNQQDAIWNAVDPTGKVAIPKTDLVSTLNSAKAAMGPVKASAIPSEFDNLVSQMPQNVPLMHYKDLNTYAQNLASKYYNAGDNNAGYAMDQIVSALQHHAGEVPMNTIAGQFMPAADATATAQRFSDARNYSKQLFNTFGKNPLASIFNTDATGAPSVEPVAIVNKLMNPSKPSGLALANQALNIGGVPQGKADITNMAVSKIMNDAMINGKVDSQGNRLITGAGLNKSLRVNSPLIQQAIPNQTSRYLLGQIGKAAAKNDMIQGVTGTGNSTTPLDMGTHRLIDDLMGKFVQPTPMELGLGGAVAGSAMEGGKAVLPMYAAGRIGGGILRRVGAKNAEQMQDLIYQAITNPNEGLKLMQSASIRNAQKLAPGFSKYWQLPAPALGAYQGLQAAQTQP